MKSSVNTIKGVVANFKKDFSRMNALMFGWNMSKLMLLNRTACLFTSKNPLNKTYRLKIIVVKIAHIAIGSTKTPIIPYLGEKSIL